MEVIHHEHGRDALYKIWNTVDGAMIIYTYSNGGSIVFADKILPIRQGALCLIGKEKQHYTMPDIPSEYDRSKILIPDGVLTVLINTLPKTSNFHKLFAANSVVYAMIPSQAQYEVEEIFKTTSERLNDGFGEETVVAAFFELMTYLGRYATQKIPAPKDFLSKAVEYINANYSAQISLEDVCGHIHVSKHYFCRRFKEVMGITVMNYISKTRIAAAKDMLACTNMRIGEISDRCGFPSQSYFCQVFKESVGVSAAKYRKSTDRKL